MRFIYGDADRGSDLHHQIRDRQKLPHKAPRRRPVFFQNKQYRLSSNIDYPCNSVVLRSVPLPGNPLVEFRLDEDILRSVLQTYEPESNLEEGTIHYLRKRFPLFSSPPYRLDARSRWLVGYPEKGIRICKPAPKKPQTA
jgi:hypothetical protein